MKEHKTLADANMVYEHLSRALSVFAHPPGVTIIAEDSIIGFRFIEITQFRDGGKVAFRIAPDTVAKASTGEQLACWRLNCLFNGGKGSIILSDGEIISEVLELMMMQYTRGFLSQYGIPGGTAADYADIVREPIITPPGNVTSEATAPESRQPHRLLRALVDRHVECRQAEDALIAANGDLDAFMRDVDANDTLPALVMRDGQGYVVDEGGPADYCVHKVQTLVEEGTKSCA